jgi:hypothetical protein
MFIIYCIVGSHSSLVYQTPNGTRYWCPEVKLEKKPVVGKIYNSWDAVYQMYESYGELSGFGIRSTACKKWKGEITHRVLACNRSGKPKTQMFDSMNPESYTRTRGAFVKVNDCKALIRLKAVKGSGGYLLYEFVEKHNHDLVSSDNMDLTRRGRHLNFEDIQFVHTMSLHRVGPTVAHRYHTALKGGHHNMRGTRNSYKNVSRDIRLFIGERDVQLFVNKMDERSKTLPNFSFEFLHQDGELKGIFWADDVSKVSYKTFGDVLAFDATYQTNK